MERDLRRGQGEWKGCYTFKDTIASDQDMPKIRNGGLKMGATYYYYYEIDGSTETHDSNMPSTTACPYLPGQAVNVLTVPTQRSSLQRSASLTSMRISDYRTMNPDTKFIPPHSTPDVPAGASSLHKRSAPGLRSMASNQSFSASPTWRRLFSSKARDEERGRSCERENRANSPSILVSEDRSVSVASNRSRGRSISPESLRRFLSDDLPPRPGSNLSEPPTLIIPDEIMEENEDDDDFAISAVSEAPSFTTRLSPPPYQRLSSAGTFTAPLTMANLSTLTLDTMRPTSKQESSHHSNELLPSNPGSGVLTSAGSSALASPLSAIPLEDEMLTFYDESNNDEDEHLEEASASGHRDTPQASFFGYKLPENDQESQPRTKPRLTLGTQLSVPIAETSYLISPVATGFGIDDFVSELGWIVDSIGNKPE